MCKKSVNLTNFEQDSWTLLDPDINTLDYIIDYHKDFYEMFINLFVEG